MLTPPEIWRIRKQVGFKHSVIWNSFFTGLRNCVVI